MNKTKSLIPYSIATMLMTLCVAGTVVVSYFEPVITPYLFGYGVDYNSDDVQEAAKKGRELAIEIESKGAVLLKNENNNLPYTDKKVNVFGFGGCDHGYEYMGGGSGHGPGNDRKSFYAGLKEAGFTLNDELCTKYNSLPFRRKSGYTLDHKQNHKLYEPGEEFYDSATMEAAKAFSENSIIVITRYGQEGSDIPKVQFDQNGNQVDNGRHYLELTEGEELLIQKVTDTFDKVTVVLNTANTMECGFLNNEKIDSALYMGMGGAVGSVGVGKLLSGEVTPSGHLSDTYAYDLTTAPTYVNAGWDGIGRFQGKMAGMYPSTYSDYGEGIYVGYRWYETADHEGIWDAVDNEYGKGYDGVVQYPFGFGKSYATFDWAVSSVNYNNGSTLNNKNAFVEMKVIVTNTSDTYSGSDVVQLYNEAPYTKGGIEKSSIVLADFAKTSVLEPGKSEELTLKVTAKDLGNYDCYDMNNNGFMGYETEGGTYKLSLRTDVHNLKKLEDNLTPIYEYNIPKDGFKYEKDEKTGYEVKNRFTTTINETSGAQSEIVEKEAAAAYSIDGKDSGQDITFLTRSDFKGTMPVHNGDRKGDSIYDTCKRHDPFINEEDIMPDFASTKTHWKLSDMGGVPFDDPRWDELVSQMTIEELAIISARGGYTAVPVESIGKPKGVVVDGPSGLNSGIMSPDGVRAICYPCQTILACTWDWKEAYKMGVSVGNEAFALGITQWYGPGLNMHRSPLGGRNFEYWSEDPILAGKLCAREIQGAKERGLGAYVKHFAANDSDTGRNGQYRFLTEQAFREIYLKPFEIAVKVGGCNAMMTSVDRIGTTRVAGSYALLTEVLRNEWGFKGSIVTDFYQGSNVHDADENIRAGNDMQLDPNGKIEYFRDLESATAVIALQKSAKNQLWTYVEGRHLRATAEGMDLGSTMVDKTSKQGGWINGIYVFDAAIGAALLCWVIMTALGTRKQPW